MDEVLDRVDPVLERFGTRLQLNPVELGETLGIEPLEDAGEHGA